MYFTCLLYRFLYYKNMKIFCVYIVPRNMNIHQSRKLFLLHQLCWCNKKGKNTLWEKRRHAFFEEKNVTNVKNILYTQYYSRFVHNYKNWKYSWLTCKYILNSIFQKTLSKNPSNRLDFSWVKNFFETRVLVVFERIVYIVPTWEYSQRQRIFLRWNAHQIQKLEIQSFLEKFIFPKYLYFLKDSYTTADFSQKQYIPTRECFCSLCREWHAFSFHAVLNNTLQMLFV